MTSGSSHQKICIVCGTDCSSKPRYKDSDGRYICQECYEAPEGGSSPASAAPLKEAPRDFSASPRPEASRPGRTAGQNGSSAPQKLRGRLCIAGVLVLLAAGLLIWLVGRTGESTLQAQIQERLNAIEEAGEPITLEELDAWYPPVSGNSATTYLKTFPLIAVDDVRSEDLPKKLPWTAPQAGRISRIVSNHEQALEQLHKAAAMPNARYPIDLTQGAAIKLPHLADIKAAIQLLQLEALHHASNGHPDRAVASITSQLALAQSLKMEPVVLSQLVRMAGWRLASETAETVLNTGALPSDSLTELAGAFEGLEDPNGILLGLAGEPPRIIHLFNHPQEHAEVWEFLEAPIPTGRSKDENLLFFLDNIQALQKAVRTGLETGAAEAKQLCAEIGGANERPSPSGPLYLAKRLLISLCNLPIDGAEATAVARVTQSAIAVEQYRNTQNQLPASLETLVPAFLKQVPIDPFNGKPLRYRQLDRGYAIYSVGENKTDERGDLYTPSDPADITLAIRR